MLRKAQFQGCGDFVCLAQLYPRWRPFACGLATVDCRQNQVVAPRAEPDRSNAFTYEPLRLLRACRAVTK